MIDWIRKVLRLNRYRPEEDDLLTRINAAADSEEEKVKRIRTARETGNFLVDRLVPEGRNPHATTE